MAEKSYDSIRNVHFDDIADVAKNTGLSVGEVKTLKKHLFFGKHKLYNDADNFSLERFAADPEIAFAWEKAQKQVLNSPQKSYFQKLAGHELGERSFMAQGIPYRNPNSWDSVGQRFNSTPPGAHDLAPLQPEWGTFDGFMKYFDTVF